VDTVANGAAVTGTAIKGFPFHFSRIEVEMWGGSSVIPADLRAPVSHGVETAEQGTYRQRTGAVRDWPDADLISAVRDEPPDEAALDALVSRYWGALYARCEMLTMNRQSASDLAQEAWCRVLRARRRLDPSANFGGYLATIATNLWRDQTRAARRAQALASDRLLSLDADALASDGGASLADVVPDPSVPDDDQVATRVDLDRALASLTPHLRDVLVARFLDGESSAEIGRRYGRTEQTVTAWLRQAIRDMRLQLGERGAGREGTR
jgi:RNA polymerase sigma-70 factor (ECF subfamily)